MSLQTEKDERWYGSLSRTLVPPPVDYGTPRYNRVAELLSPIAARVIDEAFDGAIGKAATEKEALHLARERVTQLYTCRLTEAACLRRLRAEALAEAKTWRERAETAAN